MSPERFLLRLAFIVCCSWPAVFCTAQETPPWPASPVDSTYYDAIKARMLGEDKKSEELLKQVIAAKPGEAAPYYDLSRLYLKQNDAQKSAEYIKKALAIDGKNKWYREQYANALTLHNEYGPAAEEYAGLAKTEKFNEQYLERSALLYQRAGKYKESLAQLEALRKKNDDEEVFLQEEQLYLKMNDVEGAARVLRELIAMQPKEARFYAILAEIYQNNKQPDKAAAVLQEMNGKFPDDPTLQMTLANQSLSKGDTAGYRSHLRKAIVNKELDAEMQLQLLRRYMADLPLDSANRKEAVSIVEQMLAQHPENIGLLSAYSYLLILNGQREAAAQQLKKAVSIKKDDFTLWQQLLETYTDRSGADSLIKWSEKAARLFPNQATVHYMNGVGYYNKRAYPEAIKALERAIDLEPEEKAEELSAMHTMLGDIYNATRNYAKSDSNYNAAIKLNPHNATVLNNYAYYLSVRNTRLSDAEKMSEESLKIRPGEGTFLDTYAWILYQEGKYKDALDYMQKAINANSAEKDPALWEHLGAIQYKLGNIDAAVEAWRKAKEYGSENTAIDKMIAERKLYE